MREPSIPKCWGKRSGESCTAIDVRDKIKGLVIMVSKLEIFHPIEDGEGKEREKLLVTRMN
jgi:hypothetical protein